jgi:hypothetical protein
MSKQVENNEKGVVAATADPVPVTPITPVELIDLLRTARARIPGYQQLPTLSAASLRSLAHVDPDFMQASFNAIDASIPMQSALTRTGDDLRQELDDSGRWTQVEDELSSMLQGVASANLDRRHRLGLVALQAYSIARQLVRQKDNSDLLPHVAAMKRLNRFGKKRRVASAPQPAPAPEPTPAEHPAVEPAAAEPKTPIPQK